MRGSPEAGAEREGGVTDESVWQTLWSFFSSSAAQQEAQDEPPSFMTIMSLKATVCPLPLADACPWIRGMQVSLWDHVCGPRVLLVWEGVEALSDKERSSLAQQTLKDEICRPLDEAAMEPKFHVLGDPACAAVTIIFGGVHDGCVQRFSFSLLVSREHLPRLLEIYDLCVNRLRVLVDDLKLLLHQTQQTSALLALFTPRLSRYLAICRDAFTATLPETTHIAQTVFGESHSLPYDVGFLVSALTSHLQTHSHTVVSGPDQDTVNRFIHTLALFSSSKDRRLSSLCRPAYAPGLRIQGLVNEPVLPDHVIIQSENPTTLVDLETQTVIHTVALTQYATFREQYLTDDRLRMFAPPPAAGSCSRSRSPSPLPGSAPAPRDDTEDPAVRTHDGAAEPEGAAHWQAYELFKVLRQQSQWVEETLVDVCRLPVELRRARICEAMRWLRSQAMFLIAYTESELQRHPQHGAPNSSPPASATGTSPPPSSMLAPPGAPNAPAPSPGGDVLSKDSLRRLKTDLSISNDADLEVFLGVAERYRPGMYRNVLGDASYIEDQLKMLLEGFL